LAGVREREREACNVNPSRPTRSAVAAPEYPAAGVAD
jgi:hypothetical protein